MTELQPSKLGTKEHWDNVYEEELTNFEELGDEGEIWFGEESIERMVDWALEHCPPSIKPLTLEIGSGNGTLLFALFDAGYDAARLSGIDYSPGAVKLSESIAATRGRDITFNTSNFLQDDPPILSNAERDGWDLLLDKGTFDAIALSDKDETGKSPASRYPGRVEILLKPGGYFVITCEDNSVKTGGWSLIVNPLFSACNFTEEELRGYFATSQTSLQYHSRIQHPTFEFGGKKGSICSSVAFRKSGPS